MPDTRYLRQIHQGWYVEIAIPAKLRPLLGGRYNLRKTLQTRDLKVAQRRRHAVVDALKGEIDRARLMLGGDDAAMAAEALSWRQELAKLSSDPRDRDETGHTPHEVALGVLHDEAERVAAQGGDARAMVDIATGRATPLKLHLEAWLSGESRAEVSKAHYRRNLNRFAEWMKAQKLPGSIEVVTQDVAARYVLEHLVGGGLAPNSVNFHVASLHNFWKWLRKRTAIRFPDGNPWEGQGVSTRQASDAPKLKRRALTDAEAATLLHSTPDQWTSDVLHILALSGMRISDLCWLRVGQCLGGWFDIQRSKTPAGIRRIPIHSGLAEIVKRLTQGRSPSAFLLAPDDVQTVEPYTVSQRLSRHRIECGVHEPVRIGVVTQSRVNNHSWRRRFVTKARQAGFPADIVGFVVGHKQLGMDGIYNGQPLETVIQAVVESVRLPDADAVRSSDAPAEIDLDLEESDDDA